MLQLGVSFNLQDITPANWAARLERLGVQFTNWPLPDVAVSDATIAEFVDAARSVNAVIVEVGAWSNPLSQNANERAEAILRCQQALALADRLGATVCVNIAGSRGLRWDEPHADNFSNATFEMIVATVQEIVDAVQPSTTCYALEMMPWMMPDSAETYLDLIHAIDRPKVAVHLDMVNIINSPRRYFDNAQLIRHTIQMLSPWIRACHAKDVILRDDLTVHLEEVPPGQGNLNYAVLLNELENLGRFVPLLLEHLPSDEAYIEGMAHIRNEAQKVAISILG